MVLELKRRSNSPVSSRDGVDFCFLSLWEKMGARAFLTALGLLAVIAMASCASPTPTPSPEPVDPREELQRTVERLLELQSGSFDLEHIEGSTSILPGILMHRAYGRAVVPDKFDVTVEAELLFPRSYLEIGMISIEGTAYMTNVLNGEWGEVSPESLPINLSNFGEILARIVDQVQTPELLGEDSLDGVDVYRIGGAILSEDLRELVPSAATGYSVALEITTDRATGSLRRALITGQVVATDLPEAQRLLTLDDLNQTVTIEPPDL